MTKKTPKKKTSDPQSLTKVCTLDEAAKILGRVRYMVVRAIQAGDVSARKAGATWIIDRTSIERYAKKQKNA